MKSKTIELELRAEIFVQDIELLKDRIARLGRLHSHVKRLSVMCFGNLNGDSVDIRIRIADGEGEVAVKFGALGAHDRTEITQKISRDQFMGFVKIFANFGFNVKIGERENFNYHLPNDVVASLVVAGHIAYIELEKMSDPEEVDKNFSELNGIAEQLDLELLKSDDKFNDLCKRLNEEVDRRFYGSFEDYQELEALLQKY